MSCKSADELMALAKSEGVTLSREDAEKYFAQLNGAELQVDDMEAVAGGCFTNLCAGDICANLC